MLFCSRLLFIIKSFQIMKNLHKKQYLGIIWDIPCTCSFHVPNPVFFGCWRSLASLDKEASYYITFDISKAWFVNLRHTWATILPYSKLMQYMIFDSKNIYYHIENLHSVQFHSYFVFFQMTKQLPRNSSIQNFHFIYNRPPGGWCQ